MEKLPDKTHIIAKALVRSGALKFGNFRLKSGMTSPYYIDLTWLLSSPEDFESATNVIAEEIRKFSSLTPVDRLASIELKGALLLPSISVKLGIPCVIVRKEAKSYGLTGRIVGGEIEKGEKIIFFDDVVTNGRSKIEGIKPLEEAGGKIDTVFAVVDREQGGKENLKEMGYVLKSVITISDIVESLMKSKELSKAQAEKILKYLRKIEF